MTNVRIVLVSISVLMFCALANAQARVDAMTSDGCKYVFLVHSRTVKEVAVGRVTPKCETGLVEAFVIVPARSLIDFNGTMTTAEGLLIGRAERGSLVGTRILIGSAGQHLSVLTNVGKLLNYFEARKGSVESIFAAIDESTGAGGLAQTPEGRNFYRNVANAWHQNPTKFWNDHFQGVGQFVPVVANRSSIPDDPKAAGSGSAGLR